MAGDWIKVEHATLDKPEVTRAAELLGIDPDAALGLFFRYWVWLDKNLSEFCPDFVRNMSEKSLETSLHCPGFASVLVSIGWARFDQKTATLHIINAERHNGKPAKTRCLDAKRKTDSRLGNVRKMSEEIRTRTSTSTTEEKVKNVGANAQPATKGERLAGDWRLPQPWGEWALVERKDWTADTVRKAGAEFRDYWIGVPGSRGVKLDWEATWRNNVRQSKLSNQPKSNGQQTARSAAASAIFGAVNAPNDTEHDISLVATRVG